MPSLSGVNGMDDWCLGGFAFGMRMIAPEGRRFGL